MRKDFRRIQTIRIYTIFELYESFEKFNLNLIFLKFELNLNRLNLLGSNPEQLSHHYGFISLSTSLKFE